MTKEEYDHYYKILEPHIGKTEIIVHMNPNAPITLVRIEDYNEEGDEWPRALFTTSDGKAVNMTLFEAITYLPRSNR